MSHSLSLAMRCCSQRLLTASPNASASTIDLCVKLYRQQYSNGRAELYTTATPVSIEENGKRLAEEENKGQDDDEVCKLYMCIWSLCHAQQLLGDLGVVLLSYNSTIIHFPGNTDLSTLHLVRVSSSTQPNMPC